MDLFDYHESCTGASLHDENWCAPSQQTCDEIRNTLMEAFRKESTSQLETLFHPPAEKTPTATDVIEEMQKRNGKGDAYHCDNILLPTATSGSRGSMIEKANPLAATPKSSAKLLGDLLRAMARRIEEQSDESRLQDIMTRMTEMLEDRPFKEKVTTGQEMGTVKVNVGVSASLSRLQNHHGLYRPSPQRRRDSGYAISEP
jgi:hypothetical protein